MKIPLGKPYIKKEVVLSEISKVLDRKWISGGPAIGEFEQAVKTYNQDTKNEYVAVSNATVALELALLKLIEEDGYDKDEVIVTSWSWVASAFAVLRVGLKPVWVDVNEYGVPEPSHVERLITNKTKAIILVHQMGIPCDLDEFEKIKNKYNIPIIEDAACAFGAEYKNKKIGNGDNITVYSFQARKCLTTGEGGMLVVPTNNDPEWFRSMRAFGTNISPLKRDTANFLLKEQFDRIGTNFKISDIQASLGIAHLSYFDEEISLRNEAGKYYNDNITKNFSELGVSIANKIPTYCTKYNWQNYHLLLDPIYNRDQIVDAMRKNDIGCKWDIQAIHLEPAINNRNIILHNTEKFHNHGLWLPFFAEITREQQDYVLETLKNVLIKHK
jgi:perosamine synthetase